MKLEEDRLCLIWPEGREASVDEVNAQIRRVVEAIGASFVHNPGWSEITDHSMICVQPLGGCVIAHDAEHGGVNHKGQLFRGRHGTEVGRDVEAPGRVAERRLRL